MEENKENTVSKEGRKAHGRAALSFDRLIQHKEHDEQTKFNQTMRRLLPEIEGYIARRLRVALRNGHLPSGKYKVEDFTDELYVRAFDAINEVEAGENLFPWLFKKADELLEEAMETEHFNELFFENIDNYTRAEWEQMQVDFSADGDGDLMLLEEFNDPSYPNYEYILKDVFVLESPEQSWLEKLNKELSDSDIHQHIDMVLHQLPAPMRSVYDLSVNQRFQPYEIAKIKRISVYQVEQYLVEAQRTIRRSFVQRFRS